MTILSSHPIQSTKHEIRFDKSYRRIAYIPVIRRIAGVNLRLCYIDILRNNVGIVRADWDVYYTVGTITLAIVRRG